MSTSMPSPPRTLPKLLKATYLADGEQLLRETRATKLYYFPGPIVVLLIVLFLDDIALSATYSWWPAVGSLSSKIMQAPNIGSTPLSKILLILFLLLTLLVVLWLLARFLRWVSTVFAVTSNRVILQRGILGRDFDEIPVGQVRGVDVHQSFGQRILGYGTVTVSSEGGTGRTIGNEAWHGIPKPFEFQRLVENATQGLSRNVGSGGWAQGTQPRGP
ncbi:MAG: PH domain-containing protein [Thermoplasmata archaeon]|nr:PH domain-containing protein [Thermoplasmata archaeon]MCI4361738.1 PH domain-containing protein [Thermoplasmata archaeon]